jgi:hypothetical protein
MLDLHARSAPNARYVSDERVPVATLDDLIGPHLGDPIAVLMKMDVQGYELQVLSGGQAILARSSLVQVEMSLLPLYETAPAYGEILEFMDHHGFRLIGIEPGFGSSSGLLLQADGLFATDAAIRTAQGLR